MPGNSSLSAVLDPGLSNKCLCRPFVISHSETSSRSLAAAARLCDSHNLLDLLPLHTANVHAKSAGWQPGAAGHSRNQTKVTCAGHQLLHDAATQHCHSAAGSLHKPTNF
jgi:hypothetical protein